MQPYIIANPFLAPFQYMRTLTFEGRTKIYQNKLTLYFTKLTMNVKLALNGFYLRGNILRN